ncbi:hypothetical protein ACFFGT_04055 [Mucilaginibacter angelicae]|uniref:Uncharacterized protein n=1 Tax=Mucilaginibacter angelicae TaxID=869718 RepID=A0ABV6L1W3_9SPHI
MKSTTAIYTLLLCAHFLIGSRPADQPTGIMLDGMGISSPSYETREIVSKASLPFAAVPSSLKYPVSYYKFGENKQLKKELDDCSENLLALWNSYSEKKLTPEGFNAYWKKEDPFCWKAAEKLSPKMYFDFRGEESKDYYLDSVRLNVADFLYAKTGGGYVENRMEKDVFLKMEKSTLSLNMANPKLHFKGRGRVEYTFWSDHYSTISAGRYPAKAVYLLGVQFRFSDDRGKKLSVPAKGFQYFIIEV